MLAAWFEENDHIDELLTLETVPIADRERVGYLIRGHNDAGPFVVEQQAYYEARDGRITWLRVLCSGFLARADWLAPGALEPGNQISISRSADSSESEPWTMLKVTSTAKSPRIEPAPPRSGWWPRSPGGRPRPPRGPRRRPRPAGRR